jgi:hypothetical protein
MKLTEEEKQEMKIILKQARKIIISGLFILIVISGLSYIPINK